MGSNSIVTMNRGVLVVGAVVLVAVGAGSAWLIGQRSKAPPPQAAVVRPQSPRSSAPAGDVASRSRVKPPNASALN